MDREQAEAVLAVLGYSVGPDNLVPMQCKECGAGYAVHWWHVLCGDAETRAEFDRCLSCL